MGIPNAKQAAGLVSTIVDVFDFITKLTANGTDDVIALGVKKAVDLVRRAGSGTISLEAVNLGLEELHHQLASRDATKDEKFKAKFDPDETTGDG